MSKEKAKSRFKLRVIRWATTLEVAARSITVRPMTTKWASCSTAGRLTFDEGLLRIAGELQDYVIVHELLHFHAPNHGKLWKSLMRAHLGKYEESEARLRKLAKKASYRQITRLTGGNGRGNQGGCLYVHTQAAAPIGGTSAAGAAEGAVRM
jgi:predicted metal-dependent hydrolase